MSGLVGKIASLFPRGTRAQVRHLHFGLTGKRPRWHYEVNERDEFFRKAMRMLQFNGITGDYAEFGCHGCMTFGLAFKWASHFGTPRHQWAFDSFEGLPPPVGDEDAHPFWVEGEYSTSLEDFKKECRRLGMAEADYSVVPGFYEDTLDRKTYQGPLPEDIAFAYVDCDLLSSTTSVLNFLMPRLKHGMIIAFDDYFCYSPDTISGERAAMLKAFATETRFELQPYQPYGWHGMSFIVDDQNKLDLYRKAGGK
jgi:hypothetical protein